MVCMVEYGRMAAMARLLKVGKFPATAEEARHEKTAAVTLHKQFHDADEANLLKEEDMHVFDSRPLTDPLHLVCCNGCKKPVKASQYAAHADRCGSLNSPSDIGLELITVSGHKKPPRKGRKASQATNGMILEEQKKLVMGVPNVGHSESKLDNPSNMLATQSMEVPNNSKFLNLNSSLQRIESPEHSECSSTDVKSESWVPSDGSSNHEGEICKKSATREAFSVPVPLATKVHYSQSSQRLRSHLLYLYNKSCVADVNDSSASKALQDNACRENAAGRWK